MLKIIILVTIIIVFFLIYFRSKEKYGNMLGAAAPYQEILVTCLNQCEKEDPDKRLLAPVNTYCNAYCDLVVSDMQQKGIPPEDFPLINFSMDKCNKICEKQGDTYEERKACLGMCYANNEVIQYCKEMECPYSYYDSDDCINMCASSKMLENNQMRWNWAKS